MDLTSALWYLLFFVLSNFSQEAHSVPKDRRRDCGEIKLNNDHNAVNTKIHRIFPTSIGHGVDVNCDFTTEDGDWTIIQQRRNPANKNSVVSFDRSWAEYENGFGSKGEDGSYWLGLRHIYELTKDYSYELRIDITYLGGDKAYASYGFFAVGGPAQQYYITLTDYNGTAGDGLTVHNGYRFSTYDRNNQDLGSHCAFDYYGGWWWFGYYCQNLSFLNGIHTHADGNWTYNIARYGQLKWDKNIRIQAVDMKIRRVNYLQRENHKHI